MFSAPDKLWGSMADIDRRRKCQFEAMSESRRRTMWQERRARQAWTSLGITASGVRPWDGPPGLPRPGTSGRGPEVRCRAEGRSLALARDFWIGIFGARRISRARVMMRVAVLW